MFDYDLTTLYFVDKVSFLLLLLLLLLLVGASLGVHVLLLLVELDEHWRNVGGTHAVAHLVDAEQAVAQLEHVVAQRDDDELVVARALLGVVRVRG